ncbi:unnamed protein product [Closterium sp. Yama58-4]|nr:unnamed protein product [Closterium sp. Yama58-4]
MALAVRQLAAVYEQVERAKLERLLETERMRMELSKDMEAQMMQMRVDMARASGESRHSLGGAAAAAAAGASGGLPEELVGGNHEDRAGGGDQNDHPGAGTQGLVSGSRLDDTAGGAAGFGGNAAIGEGVLAGSGKDEGTFNFSTPRGNLMNPSTVESAQTTATPNPVFNLFRTPPRLRLAECMSARLELLIDPVDSFDLLSPSLM